MNELYTPKLSPVKISDFARDMAIYGSDDLEGVLKAHGITPQQAIELQDNAVYKAEYARVESQLSDPHAAIRIKAQNMLPAHIDIIGDIATDRFQPGGTRLKAIEMATKLAGVADDADKQHSGVTLVLSFGGILQGVGDNVPVEKDITPHVEVDLPEGWSLDG